MNLGDHDLNQLQKAIARHGPTITAFSGGIDSTLVAFVASQIHGQNAIAITGVSPSLANSERTQAAAVADQLGIRHRFVNTHEIGLAAYRQNHSDRCFHCKSELFDVLQKICQREGYSAVMSGDNADDLQDVRPGMRAAEQFCVVHPLIEARLGKSQIRTIARTLGIPNFAKPASPCLASRVPTGTPVNEAILRQIERAESELRAIGFRIFRVRHHGDLARIEVSHEELEEAFARRIQICKAVQSAGYHWATLDLEGFRKHSLPVLNTNQIKTHS